MKTDFADMTDMTAEQRARLPKYARDYMYALERKVHEAEYSLYSATSSLGPRMYEKGKITDPRHEQGIIIDPLGRHPLAINESMTVRFWTEPGEHYIDVRIMDKRPGPGIEVHGDRSFAALPVSSNIVYVKGAEW